MYNDEWNIFFITIGRKMSVNHQQWWWWWFYYRTDSIVYCQAGDNSNCFFSNNAKIVIVGPSEKSDC